MVVDVFRRMRRSICYASKYNMKILIYIKLWNQNRKFFVYWAKEFHSDGDPLVCFCVSFILIIWSIYLLFVERFAKFNTIYTLICKYTSFASPCLTLRFHRKHFIPIFNYIILMLFAFIVQYCFVMPFVRYISHFLWFRIGSFCQQFISTY